MTKTLTAMAANTLFLIAVYCGLFAGIDGAKNIVIFCVWALFLPLGIFAMTTPGLQTLAKQPPAGTVRRIAWRCISWTTLVAFVWQGHIATGFAWGVYMLCGALAKDWAEQIRAKETQP